MKRLSELRAMRVLDSRGQWTIKVTAFANNHSASTIVPVGSSKGKHESEVISAGSAVKRVNALSDELSGKKLDLIDSLIKDEPGNVSTGISIVVHQLIAKIKHKPFYEWLGGNTLPIPFMNVINGGVHAGNKLSFQEFMIVPQAENFSESLRIGTEVYHSLREHLVKKYGHNAVNVGLEGGFAPLFKRVRKPFKILTKVIDELGYSKKVGLAVDAAATQFFSKGQYLVDGKKYDSEALMDFYESLVEDFNIISIEDPFHEEDFDSFSELTWRLKTRALVVGDDLLVTSPLRLKKAISDHAGNCLLLKVNQIGLLSQAVMAAEIAMNNQWRVMVSHRSGDSCDSFISDLAVGLNTGMIKTGAPARGERTAKYNRLLEIEQELGSEAVYPEKLYKK